MDAAQRRDRTISLASETPQASADLPRRVCLALPGVEPKAGARSNITQFQLFSQRCFAVIQESLLLFALLLMRCGVEELPLFLPDRDQQKGVSETLDIVHADTGRNTRAAYFAAIVDALGEGQVQRGVWRNQGV